MNQAQQSDGVQSAVPEVSSGPRVIDADVHPSVRGPEDLEPFMSARHWKLFAEFGAGGHTPFGYPKAVPNAHRADARPADGSVAGSDFDLLKEQYLDALNVEYAMLSPLRHAGQEAMHPELAPAICSASNDWQLETWTQRDKRLKASILVPIEMPELAAMEIERRAQDSDFAQVLLLTRTSDPLGNRRYWPIFEKAVQHDLPVAVHVFGSPGHPPTSAGWPDYYLEEMTSHSSACQGMISSMIIEGLFEAYPGLSIVNLEGGFGWVPSLAWRMDRLFDRYRREVPHLRRRPSEYLRENFYFATQPIEEPRKKRHLVETINWIGSERVLFSSDYPHWDFDDPVRALPGKLALGKEAHDNICIDNARKVYRLN